MWPLPISNSEFNNEVAFADEAMVLDIIINSDTFSEFRPRLEGTPHSAPHLYLGEHMESMVCIFHDV